MPSQVVLIPGPGVVPTHLCTLALGYVPRDKDTWPKYLLARVLRPCSLSPASLAILACISAVPGIHGTRTAKARTIR